ncbi:hypothetical protein AURDEDRAFT_116333 [Auricularia subglabra TFB-10046 SS5]|nr:hypothetical protein AURDEDRAFT_116333 [Auricularia subglabra TFB-10046 SS5]
MFNGSAPLLRKVALDSLLLGTKPIVAFASVQEADHSTLRIPAAAFCRAQFLRHDA